MTYYKVFDKYCEIILEIKEEEFYTTESGLASYKAILSLKGNYTLRIKEIRNDDKLIKYSYYWLDDTHKLIIGWDNAPHHINVDSYPHHKHKQKNIYSSGVKNLNDVLEKIRDKYKTI